MLRGSWKKLFNAGRRKSTLEYAGAVGIESDNAAGGAVNTALTAATMTGNPYIIAGAAVYGAIQGAAAQKAKKAEARAKGIEAESKALTDRLRTELFNTRNFKVDFIESEYVFDKSIRLTLDYKDDLILFDKIFKYFEKDIEKFTLKDVLIFLRKNPKIIKINNHHRPKFSKKDLNLNLKI